MKLLVLMLVWSVVESYSIVLFVKNEQDWLSKKADALMDVAHDVIVLDEHDHTSVQNILQYKHSPKVVVAVPKHIDHKRRQLQVVEGRNCNMTEYVRLVGGLHSLGLHVDIILGMHEPAHALGNITRVCQENTPHVVLSISDSRVRRLIQALGVPPGWASDVHRVIWLNGTQVLCESSSRDATEAYEKCGTPGI